MSASGTIASTTRARLRTSGPGWRAGPCGCWPPPGAEAMAGAATPLTPAEAMTRLAALADHLDLWGDPVFRDRHARLALDLADWESLVRGCAGAQGPEPDARALVAAILQAELPAAIAEL